MIEVARYKRYIDIAALPNRFAIVERLQHRKPARVLLHLSRQGIQVPCPLMRRERVPSWERSASRFDRRVNIGRASLSNTGELVPARWIGSVEVLALHRLLPAAVYEVSELALVTLEPGKRLFRVLKCRTVFHRCELFGNFAHRI